VPFVYPKEKSFCYVFEKNWASLGLNSKQMSANQELKIEQMPAYNFECYQNGRIKKY
jgi:hypothetical protein